MSSLGVNEALYVSSFFFLNDTATTEIYTFFHTLSLHDALPICPACPAGQGCSASVAPVRPLRGPEGVFGKKTEKDRRETASGNPEKERSEEHTSELQSLMRISYAVFCLKKNKSDI